MLRVESKEEADRFRRSSEERGYVEEGYNPGRRSAEDEWAITTWSACAMGWVEDVRGDFEDPRIHISGEHSLASTPRGVSSTLHGKSNEKTYHSQEQARGRAQYRITSCRSDLYLYL
jgi:hypothetical protein